MFTLYHELHRRPEKRNRKQKKIDAEEEEAAEKSIIIVCSSCTKKKNRKQKSIKNGFRNCTTQFSKMLHDFEEAKFMRKSWEV
jgi:predicted metal-binding protein